MDLTINGIGGSMWFTLSLINAGLAESKGRGRLNWWLLSLLLGPITTMRSVAIGPSSSESSHQFRRPRPFDSASPALMSDSVNHMPPPPMPSILRSMRPVWREL